MSASREKKQRMQSEGLTERQRQAAAAAQADQARRRRYVALAIVAAILVVALLVWNSGIIQRNYDAATVADETFTVAEVGYYYYGILNNTVNDAYTYAQYGLDLGYDPELAPQEQMYDEVAGKTYADYFKDTALTSLQRTTLLTAEAAKAGYVLSDTGKAQVANTLKELGTYSAQAGYGKAAYLQALYGPYMTESLFEDMLSNAILAEEYQAHYTQGMAYTDAEYETYYADHAAELDTYEYRYCFIVSEPETEDQDDDSAAATEEDQAAAMAAAKEKATALAQRIRAGEAFNAAAAEYVSEASAAAYEDPDYNHVVEAQGSSFISSAYGQWLADPARTAGEVGVVESTDAGYYVTQLLGRARDEVSPQTVDVRHILVLAETDSTDDDTVLPTAEQLAAAKAEVEALLAQWQSGEATTASFSALAEANTDDPGFAINRDLYTDVSRNQMIAPFDAWIFDSNRQVGDVGIVDNVDAEGNTLGYHIVYLDGQSDVRWRYAAHAALAGEAFTQWFADTQAQYPVASVDKGFSLLG